MIVKILSADLRSIVGIGIVAPTDNTCIWNIQWQEVTEPVDLVYRPSLLTVSIESMDSHNTMIDPIMSDLCDEERTAPTQRQDRLPLPKL